MCGKSSTVLRSRLSFCDDHYLCFFGGGLRGPDIFLPAFSSDPFIRLLCSKLTQEKPPCQQTSINGCRSSLSANLHKWMYLKSMTEVEIRVRSNLTQNSNMRLIDTPPVSNRILKSGRPYPRHHTTRPLIHTTFSCTTPPTARHLAISRLRVAAAPSRL